MEEPEGRSIVPFKTRTSKALHSNLKKNSTFTGFSYVPVYVNSDSMPVYSNPIELNSCHFIWSEYSVRWDSVLYDDVHIFYDQMYLFHKLKFKFAWVMGLSVEERDNMTFRDAFEISQLVYSQRTEGLPQRVGWTKEDEKDMNLTIKYGLSRPLTNNTRNIFVTKAMEDPVAKMQNIMRQMLNGVPYKNITTTKFDLFSVGEEQFAHFLLSYAPVQWWTQLKYASVIKIELRVNNDCLSKSTAYSDDSYCFKVRMKYNGVYLDFRRSKFYDV